MDAGAAHPGVRPGWGVGRRVGAEGSWSWSCPLSHPQPLSQALAQIFLPQEALLGVACSVSLHLLFSSKLPSDFPFQQKGWLEKLKV